MKVLAGFVFLVILSMSSPLVAGFPPEPTAADLQSCETSFKYKGKFINPRLLMLFEGWESDTGTPAITTVDVAAAYGTNQFYETDVKYEKTGASGRMLPRTRVLLLPMPTGGSGVLPMERR